MLLKMMRSQKTELGLLRAGIAYKFDPKNARHTKVADHLLVKKLAEKTTQKTLEVEAEELARLTEAQIAGGVIADDAVVSEAVAVAAEAARQALETKAAEDARLAEEAKAAAEAKKAAAKT